ncbi:related to alpha glucosidase II beta subunit [Serendipita indica DSM 11827]|uniref:Glucosidase 2 subunit beta n=1 Tax=Serendipita indica (strain DSM 11827) TaxID=1109443 RepID=G4TB33_SERID|nr:related to alpha glucosidase II beta subunit [Serendipita indica DSM 11827]
MLPPTITLLSLVLPLTASAALSADPNRKLRGVLPARRSLYTPTSAGTWKCLNGNKEISWDKVNDDFCDCPDGSDEPGTSACPNSTFYCVNEGHEGATISSTRVDDGLCEKECCDGSDEPEGVCPNVCEEVGKEYRQRREAEAKLRKTGSKIRSTYVIFAEKEKKRLQSSIAALKLEVEAKKKEEAHAKILLDHAESMSQASLAYKQQSPLYQSLVKHSEALKSLQARYQALQNRERALSDVLRNLKEGYNPNYQDMAVLEAVRGWDGLNPDASPVEETTESSEPVAEKEETVDPWDDNAISTLLREDHVSLLLQHDSHISQEDSTEEEGNHSAPFDRIGLTGAVDSVFDLESYVPDSLYPAYENARTQVVGLLTKLGVVRESTTAKARERHNTAINQLRNTESKLYNEEQALNKLYDPKWYGADGAWKKLEGTCLSYNTGEYTYEVCLFGQATQKSNNGGGSHSLGHFSSWNTSAPEGTPEYYSRQVYKHGAKCWNGPERSITVDLVCGTENVLLSVSEPEKCEYRVTGTTPALCFADTADKPAGSSGAKEEL